MRRFLRVLCFACLALAVPAGAPAQTGGALCVFSDTQGGACNFTDEAPGVIDFHVVHVQATEVRTVQFLARVPQCMNGATWLADIKPFVLTIGDSQNGVAVSYDACTSTAVHVLTVSVFGEGLSTPDCAYPVTAHPLSNAIEVATCDNNVLYAVGGVSYINSSLPCDCDASGQPALNVSPQALDFGTETTLLDFDIANPGGGVLLWEVAETHPWLGVSATSGSGPQTISVGVDRHALAPGPYAGVIEVTSNGGDATVGVSMEVEANPILEVTPPSLTFWGTNTTRELYISNVGNGTLTWDVSDNAPWLAVSPTAGTDAATLTVTVDRTGYDPGEYTGTVRVNSNGGTIDVPVTMHVPDTDPELHVSPTSITFGFEDVTAQLFITNVGLSELVWSIANTIPWLDAAPSSGTGGATVTLTVDRTGLADGVYNDAFVVTSNGGDVTVDVSMTVLTTPELQVSPTFLDFGESLTTLTFDITNTAAGTLSWTTSETAAWLSLSPENGVGNAATVTATVDRTGLAPGNHTELVTVTSNGGSQVVTATLHIPAPEPVLEVSPAALEYEWDVDAHALQIVNGGEGELQWNATSTSWIGVTPAAGAGDATVTVTVDRTGLADGMHTGSVEITSNGGDVTVPVTIQVLTGPVLAVYPPVLIFSSGNTAQGFTISNDGPGALTWSLSADRDWIVIEEPLEGSGDATVAVQVIPAEVDETPGHVTVTSNGGTETVTINYAVGGSGALGVYADPAGTNCAILDQAPGVLSVYIVHVNSAGAGAVQFWAPQPSCMTAGIWLGDTSPFSTAIGNSQDGVAVAYGACLGSPVHVLTIQYFTQGLSEPCCLYPVLPDPNSLTGTIEIVDCANSKLVGNGIPARINPDGSCPCGTVVDVHVKTWGEIKAQFVDDWDTPEWRAKQKQ